jgi:hypothetical protein
MSSLVREHGFYWVDHKEVDIIWGWGGSFFFFLRWFFGGAKALEGAFHMSFLDSSDLG